jgi:hypothetical protein
MMHGSRAISVALWLSGPTIWAVHFILVYASESVLCPRPAGVAAHAFLVVLSTAAAIPAIVALAYLGGRGAFVAEGPFLRSTGIALSSLAAIAVLWTAMPSLFLTACLRPV